MARWLVAARSALLGGAGPGEVDLLGVALADEHRPARAVEVSVGRPAALRVRRSCCQDDRERAGVGGHERVDRHSRDRRGTRQGPTTPVVVSVSR